MSLIKNNLLIQEKVGYGHFGIRKQMVIRMHALVKYDSHCCGMASINVRIKLINLFNFYLEALGLQMHLITVFVLHIVLYCMLVLKIISDVLCFCSLDCIAFLSWLLKIIIMYHSSTFIVKTVLFLRQYFLRRIFLFIFYFSSFLITSSCYKCR